MDLAKPSSWVALLAITILSNFTPQHSYGQVKIETSEDWKQEITPFIGHEYWTIGEINISDQPSHERFPHGKNISGKFRIDSFAGFNADGWPYLHVTFADGETGYYAITAGLIKYHISDSPPPPPPPLTYPSFLDRLPAKEAAKRHLLPGVELGMTQDQVLASAWGKPNRTKEIKNTRSDRVCWYYANENTLCFNYGKLYAIQK